MYSNGFTPKKIIDKDKECIIVEYEIDEFYVQLAGGRTVAHLNPNKNLECRVTLKLKEKQPVEKEFYAVFGCWNAYVHTDKNNPNNVRSGGARKCALK